MSTVRKDRVTNVINLGAIYAGGGSYTVPAERFAKILVNASSASPENQMLVAGQTFTAPTAFLWNATAIEYAIDY